MSRLDPCPYQRGACLLLRGVIALLLVIGAVSLLAGCGGGGDDCTEAPQHIRTDRAHAQWRLVCETGRMPGVECSGQSSTCI